MYRKEGEVVDGIAVEPGAKPWEPAGDAVLVQTYDTHDIPLAGVIAQAGQRFLFTCIHGEMAHANLWAYAPVTSWEESKLDEATGDELLDLIEATFTDRMVVLAAANHLQIEYAANLDAGREGLLVLGGRFLARWKSVLLRQQDHAAALTAATELISR